MPLLRSLSRLAILASCLSTITLVTPAHTQAVQEPKAESWLYCGSVLTTYAGFLLGRFEADPSFGYDVDEAVAYRRDGLAFTLIGMDEISRQYDPSTQTFVTIYKATSDSQIAKVKSFSDREAADAYYASALAQCDALRATRAALFLEKAAQAEIQFADLIEQTRQRGGQ